MTASSRRALREAAVDKEGNLVTKAIARRERMGHITLAAPVAHIWFMRGMPSATSLLLNITVKNIERIVYFAPISSSIPMLKITTTLNDLEAETTAAREAINLRYEQLATDKNTDLKALAKSKLGNG